MAQRIALTDIKPTLMSYGFSAQDIRFLFLQEIPRGSRFFFEIISSYFCPKTRHLCSMYLSASEIQQIFRLSRTTVRIILSKGYKDTSIGGHPMRHSKEYEDRLIGIILSRECEGQPIGLKEFLNTLVETDRFKATTGWMHHFIK